MASAKRKSHGSDGYFGQVGRLYRQQSGFAPQYFVLGHQTTSSRVYTRVKRLGEAQTFSEAVYFENPTKHQLTLSNVLPPKIN